MAELAAVIGVAQVNRIRPNEQWKPTPRDTLDSATVNPPQPPVNDEASEASNQAPKEQLPSLDYRLAFKIDESSGKVLVQVLDSITGQVVRQIPPEEMLRLAQMIRQYLGLVVDSRH